jgi:hypothetical protein
MWQIRSIPYGKIGLYAVSLTGVIFVGLAILVPGCKTPTESQEYDEIKFIDFRPDGRRATYAGLRGSKNWSRDL